MITLAITNRKGGVGKTMFSISLASLLAGLGYKVVLVDTDPQGNVAKWFDMPEESGIYDLLIKGTPLASLLKAPPQEFWWPEQTAGELLVLPGNYRTTTAGMVLAMNREPDDTLKGALRPLEYTQVDFVLIDTSPTVTPIQANVYVAADFALIPTAPEMLSVNAVTKTIEDINDKEVVETRGGPLAVIGVVPNKYQKVYAEHRAYLKELEHIFGEGLWPAVPYLVTFEKAPSLGKSIFAHAPRQKASQAVRALGYHLLKRMDQEGVLA
ncbi:MAG TPA: ParA family protein [Aggregatilineaceae bacterium]|nr:ParA family protein [Aggregatilineaceae bacterium]